MASSRTEPPSRWQDGTCHAELAKLEYIATVEQDQRAFKTFYWLHIGHDSSLLPWFQVLCSSKEREVKQKRGKYQALGNPFVPEE